MRRFALLLVFFLLAGLTAPLSISAVEPGPEGCENLTGLDLAQCRLQDVREPAGFGAETDPVVIVGNAINIFLSILGVIFLVLTVYGGYLWMTARGDEQQVTKAKDVLKAATIGIAITLASYAISSFVVSRLAATTSEEGVKEQ